MNINFLENTEDSYLSFTIFREGQVISNQLLKFKKIFIKYNPNTFLQNSNVNITFKKQGRIYRQFQLKESDLDSFFINIFKYMTDKKVNEDICLYSVKDLIKRQHCFFQICSDLLNPMHPIQSNQIDKMEITTEDFNQKKFLCYLFYNQDDFTKVFESILTEISTSKSSYESSDEKPYRNIYVYQKKLNHYVECFLKNYPDMRNSHYLPSLRLIALWLSWKVGDDYEIKNNDLITILVQHGIKSINLKRLNQMEFEFCKAIDWQLLSLDKESGIQEKKDEMNLDCSEIQEKKDEMNLDCSEIQEKKDEMNLDYLEKPISKQEFSLLLETFNSLRDMWNKRIVNN